MVTCELCWEVKEDVFVNSCSHSGCATCLKSWVDRHLPSCKQSLQLRMPCFDSKCQKTMKQQLVIAVSDSARLLADRLEKRFVLEKNILYPLDKQVRCPRPDCVGLGYLGFDTVMCFMCEYQWRAEQSQKLKNTIHLPEEVKPCPRCNVLIEKEGGCDHMTCLCGYDFVWSTGEMWTPDFMKDVILSDESDEDVL